MLTNYLKIALRNIRRRKGLSILNIMGLAVGLAGAILILLWVSDELSFDRYHKNAGRIFRLATDMDFGRLHGRFAVSNYIAGKTLVRDYPEVENAVRFQKVRFKILFRYEDKRFFETDLYLADNSVFEIFSFPLIRGDPESALKRPFSLVLTEDTARKYFGDEDPIGRSISAENKFDLTVTGVMQNVPANSHFRFNGLASFETLRQLYANYEEAEGDWLDHDNYTYLLLREGYDYRQLEAKFPALIEKHVGETIRALGGRVEYFLQPLTRIHLHSRLAWEISTNGDIAYVYAFSLIALLLLLIGCVNFANLSTACSADRAKEVGVRKVLGASQAELVYQFYGEIFLVCCVSLVIALVLVELTLPVFRSLAGAELSFASLPLVRLMMCLSLLVCLVVLLGGSYPAFFLSGYRLTSVLRGHTRTGPAGLRLRSVLVIFQFSISIALIAASVVAFDQIRFMKQKPLGFDKDAVVVTRAPRDISRRPAARLKAALQDQPGIVDIAASSHVPGQTPARHVFLPEGFTWAESQVMDNISVSPGFVSTMKLELAGGRDFSLDSTTDQTGAILINEAAARRFNWKNPLGKTIYCPFNETTKTVVGVVKDYHLRSPQYRIYPLYIDWVPSNFIYLSIRLRPQQLSKSISLLHERWNDIYPDQPFEYFFLDEAFDRQYRTVEKLSSIFGCFTVLAIVLACLGLLGLASFAAQQRTKEIGIRKALGAAVSNIVLLLTGDVVKWVLLANIIAWPVAYVVMNRWLQDFAHRIRIGLDIFVLAGLLALVFALLTVGYQALKAARANPAEALRYE